MIRPPSTSTLFPYTTLFRSQTERAAVRLPGLRHRGMETGGPDNLTMADRKSTRLNSSHQIISYAVFCLKKKKKYHHPSQADLRIMHYRLSCLSDGWWRPESY